MKCSHRGRSWLFTQQKKDFYKVVNASESSPKTFTTISNLNLGVPPKAALPPLVVGGIPALLPRPASRGEGTTCSGEGATPALIWTRVEGGELGLPAATAIGLGEGGDSRSMAILIMAVERLKGACKFS